MSSFAVFGVTVFGGTICFLMGFISGRIWQQYIDRPVAYHGLNGWRTDQQAAPLSAADAKAQLSQILPQVYPGRDQYRMGDWDKGRDPD